VVRNGGGGGPGVLAGCKLVIRRRLQVSGPGLCNAHSGGISGEGGVSPPGGHAPKGRSQT